MIGFDKTISFEPIPITAESLPPERNCYLFDGESWAHYWDSSCKGYWATSGALVPRNRLMVGVFTHWADIPAPGGSQ